MNPHPQFLYHGTRAGALPSILAHGLRPRRDRGAAGNWKHSVESNSRAVYLTDAYALHFATNALGARREDLLVLEIDFRTLDPARLAPDEDFLEQATRGRPEHACAGATMKARTQWFRKRAHSDFSIYWLESLRGLGTCTYYGAIPPEAIHRWARLPCAHPLVRMSDPTITLMNYAIMGEYYRRLTQYIFGDPVPLEDAPHHNHDALRHVAALGRDGIVVDAREAARRARVC